MMIYHFRSVDGQVRQPCFDSQRNVPGEARVNVEELISLARISKSRSHVEACNFSLVAYIFRTMLGSAEDY